MDASNLDASGSRKTRGEGKSRRQVVYGYVATHPGAHAREVARELGIATGDAQYHLYWLERHGFIETSRNGFHRFVFPAGVFNQQEKVLLGLLSQESPRAIILLLIENVEMTQSELARRTGHSQPTISWHMERLVSSGVVNRDKSKNKVRYQVASDPALILRLVKDYHRSVWRRWRATLGEERLQRLLTGAPEATPLANARHRVPLI